MAQPTPYRPSDRLRHGGRAAGVSTPPTTTGEAVRGEEAQHRLHQPQALLAVVCFAGIPVAVIIGEIVKGLS